MEFVKNIIISSLLLCGLLVAWPGQGVLAQGEGVQLLVENPTDTSRIMLGINRVNYGNFAPFNADVSEDDSRLIIETLNPQEIIRIGLSSGERINQGNVVFTEYRYQIRDMETGDVVHGPHSITEANDNIETWEDAKYAPGSGGYSVADPIYTYRPQKKGSFSIEFALTNNGEFFIPNWNFTVVDPTNTPDSIKTGRLWSKNWSFRTPQDTSVDDEFCIWNRTFGGDFYSYTTDSLITRVDFAGTMMRGLSFNIAFNSTGPGNPGDDLLERRRSREDNNATDNSAEHQIFLSQPDPNLFPSLAGECATVEVQEDELSCVEGSFCLPISVSSPGQIELSWVRAEGDEIPIALSDFPRSAFPASGPLDTCIAITVLDSIGSDVSSLRLRVSYSRGAQHWSAYDVEFMDKGFCVTTDLPESCMSIPGFMSGNNTLYWDDSELSLDPGTSGGIKESPLNGAGCDTPLRSWNNFTRGNQPCVANDIDDSETSGYGDKSTLNTWWYAYTQELDIIEIPIPAVAIIGPDTICTDVDVIYRADISGFDEMEVLTFNWTGPNGLTGSLDTIVTAGMGEYCVTVTNENGCVRSTCKVLTIGEGAGPNVSLPISVVIACPGDDVELTVDNNDLSQTLTYEWMPATAFVDNTLAMPDYLEEQGAQQLTVTVTSFQSGCDTTLTTDIIIPEPIEIEAAVIFDDVCTPIDTLRATVSDGAIVEWLDANGDVVGTGLELVTNTGPGTTTFIARARSTNPACLDTVFSAPLTLRYEPVNITVMPTDSIYCPGEEVILSVVNNDSPRDTLTYVWAPADAFVDNTLAMPDYLESTGSQTVTVTATNQFGCVDSRSTTVTILPPVELDAAVVFDDVCTPIDTLRATASDGAIVEWLDANGDVVGTGLELVTNTDPGTTTFIARARSTSTGCLDTVFSPPLIVRYEPVDITVMPTDSVYCPGEEVILSVVNNDSPRDTLTYLWTPADAFVDNTLAMPDYLESAGNQAVTVTATNQFGCVDSRSTTVTILPPVELDAAVVFDDVCTPIDTLRATASDGAIVEWLDANGDVVGTGLELVTNTGPGTTTFIARARSTSAGCLDTVFSPPLIVRYEPVDITVMPTDSIYCPGEEVILSVVNNDSPRDTLTYVWAPADAFVDNTLAMPDYLESTGSQTVTVTATNQFGCVDSRSTTVTILPPVELDAAVVFDDVCTPIDTLRATASDGAIVEWLDANGDVVGTGLELVTNTDPGTTTFIARARSTSAGCLDTVFSPPLIVRYEPVDITVMPTDSIYCPGEEVILSVVNNDSPRDTLTYVWAPADAFVDNTLAMPDYLESTGSQTVTVTATNQFGCVDSRSTTVTILPPVELDAAVVFDDVCTPIDTLRATASDGAIVEWLDANGDVVGTGLELVTNTGPGTTTFIARARSTSTGCLDTVFSPPLIVRYEPVDITVMPTDSIYCPGEEVILSVVNNDSPRDTLTYVWAPADAFVDNTLAMPDYLESTGSQTVTVTATNQFGCVDSRSTTVTILPPVELDAAVVFDDVCTPIDTLRATASDGAIVEWLDANGDVVGTGLELVTNTDPGTTTFIARARSTSAGCLDTVFSPPLIVRYEPVDITVMPTDSIYCPGEEVILSVVNNDSPRDTLTYVWAPADAFVDNTLAMPDYLESTGSQTVTVTATNQFGCVDSRSTTVTILPPVELDAAVVFDDVCTPIDTLRATVSDGAIVEWLDANGDVVGTGLELVTNTGPGTTTFIARARSTSTGCLDTVFSPPLIVRYEPVDITVMPTDSIYCPGEEVILSVVNNDSPRDTLTYVWAPADAFVDNTLAMPDYLESTGSQTVTVTATNQFGCVDSRSTTVTILPPVELDAAVVFDDVCTPIDTLRATVSEGATVEWLDADGNVVGTGLELITNTGEGQSSFTARATNEACDLVVLSEPLTVRFEPVSISVDQECIGSNLELSAINNGPIDVTFVWTPADAFVDNTLAMPDYLEERGIQPVTVTATNEFQCQDSETVTTIECAVCTPDGVYLPNFFSPNGDNSNDVLRLRSSFLEELVEVELMIYNRWGEEVFRTTDKSAQWDGTFKGEQLAPDVYGYWLRYLCPGDQPTIQKGNITLMR